ncbi:hypothetical protein RHSIM_Rhsim10G0131000 [Rhododendron simsii]|uniref:Uncharacterized protein n=1 Tax=Rhododendron simsii TaxID=118357 RepID=A0A834GCY7_RHOSS|nr:hypothetical protein RHSIM_Rhsim10G0131000 [Rhododendron simsii]
MAKTDRRSSNGVIRTEYARSQKRNSDHRSVLPSTCRKFDEEQRQSGEGRRSCGEGQRELRWLGQRQATSKQYRSTSEQYGSTSDDVGTVSYAEVASGNGEGYLP